MLSCAFCVALIPFIGQLLPLLMSTRITSDRQVLVALLPITLTMLILFVTPLLVAAFAQRVVAGALLVLSCVMGGVYIKSAVYPVLDQQVSPRGLWRQLSSNSSAVCDGGLHRAWAYGFAFYRGTPFPPCSSGTFPIHLVQKGSQRPEVNKAVEAAR